MQKIMPSLPNVWRASNLANLQIPKHTYRCNIISPFYPYVKEQTHKWENEFYKMKDQKAFIRQDFPMFASLAYPRAVSAERLLIASKFSSIAFAMDTDLENMITNDDIKGISNYATNALNVLNGQQYDGDICTLKAFSDVFAQFKSDATEYQYKCMSFAYQQFVKADHLLSVNYNIPRRVLPLSKYFEYSRPNSCSNLLTTLIDYVQGVCFEEKYQKNFLNNRNTIALINNCNDYLAISNDIISLLKEYINFEMKNYVICHHLENNCTLQESLDATVDLLYTTEQTIHRLVEKIRQSNILPENDLTLWIDGFYDVLYGVAQWYQFSNRYSIDNINYNASDITSQRLQQIYLHDEQPVELKTSKSFDYIQPYKNLENDWEFFRIDK